MGFKRIKSWFESERTSERRFLRTPVGIFLLGAFLGELAPDPTDAVHFWLQEHVLNNHRLSAPTLAFLQVFDWYFMSALYFLFLLILAYALHIRRVDTVRRITIIGGVIATGVVIGILSRFVLR